MVDSVTSGAIPKGTPVVAGWIDGAYGPINPAGWPPAAWKSFPGSQTVTMTALGAAGARVYDIERGLGTPAQGAAWAKRETTAGRRPTIYCTLSAWSSVRLELVAVGLPLSSVDFWIADTSIGQHIPAGAVALQYAQNVPGVGGHNIDLSITNGVWPGTPAPPIPLPPSVQEDTMAFIAGDPSPANEGGGDFLIFEGGVKVYLPEESDIVALQAIGIKNAGSMSHGFVGNIPTAS